MSDTKLRPEDLTGEERMLVDRVAARFFDTAPSRADAYRQGLEASTPAILARRALFATAPEKAAKVSAFPVGNCVVCGELVAPYNKHAKYEGGYTCQPAPPEPTAPVVVEPTDRPMDFNRSPFAPAAPVAFATPEDTERERQQHEADMENVRRSMREPAAPEMPEAVRFAVSTLRTFAKDFLKRDSFYSAIDASKATKAADALEREWRNLAQPVAVGMTRELLLLLEKVDDAVTYRLQHGSLEEAHILTELAAAVRQQAAQGRKVEFPKVREFFNYMQDFEYTFPEAAGFDAAIAELDAAEGKGANT